MIIIVPVGRETSLSRKPIATIGLVVLLVSIHLYTDATIERQTKENLEAQLEYAQLLAEFQAEQDSRDFATGRSPSMPDGGNTYIETMRSFSAHQQKRRAEIERLIESGDLYEIGSEEHTAWLAAKQRLEQSEESLLFRKVGFTPSSPSISTLISSMFFHANYGHLIFNLIFLWAAGCLIESTWGSLLYLGGYLLTGVGAVLAHWMIVGPSEVPLIGASGAIAGMMGACLICHFSERINIFWLYFWFTIRAGTTLVPAWILLGMWLVGQFTSATLFWGLEDVAGVAFWAHIGGFTCGATLAFVLRQIGVEEAITSKTLATYRASQETVARERIARGDAILAGSDETPDSFYRPSRDGETLERFGRTEAGGPAGAPCEQGFGPPGIVQRIRSAERYYRQGRKEDARVAVEDVLREDEFAPAHALMAIIAADDWEFRKARRHASRAIEIYSEGGFSERAFNAIEELKQAGIRQPAGPKVLFQVACNLQTDAATGRAMQLFQEIAATYPEDSLAAKSSMKAGLLLERMKCLEDARQCYSAAFDMAQEEAIRQQATERLRLLDSRQLTS